MRPMTNLLELDSFNAFHVDVDEGLARHELRRQVGRLERGLAALFAEAFGSSSSSMIPAGEDADFDIFAPGSCRSVIFPVALMMNGSGTVK